MEKINYIKKDIIDNFNSLYHIVEFEKKMECIEKTQAVFMYKHLKLMLLDHIDMLHYDFKINFYEYKILKEFLENEYKKNGRKVNILFRKDYKRVI